MQGEQQKTALGRGAWEPGVHLEPVEVKPEWGIPQGEGVQVLDQRTEEQLSQDPGDGTQAFQEQGEIQIVKMEGHRKLFCDQPSPPLSFKNPVVDETKLPTRCNSEYSWLLP